VTIENLAGSEQSGELVECGLPCALVALVTMLRVNSVATAVSHFFTNVIASRSHATPGDRELGRSHPLAITGCG
jgi:hypothetical protein